MACQFCSVKLVLDVACHDNQTMDVTSNHLDVVPFSMWEDEDDDHAEEGDEPAKRGEYFGHPVGKSA